MEVSLDAGTCAATEVHTRVRAVRMQGAVQHVEAAVKELPQLGAFLGVKGAGRGEVSIRGDQQVTVGVRVEVEDHETRRPAVQNQPRLIVLKLWGGAEDALQRIVAGGALDELESPGCPEPLHVISVPALPHRR